MKLKQMTAKEIYKMFTKDEIIEFLVYQDTIANKKVGKNKYPLLSELLEITFEKLDEKLDEKIEKYINQNNLIMHENNENISQIIKKIKKTEKEYKEFTKKHDLIRFLLFKNGIKEEIYEKKK